MFDTIERFLIKPFDSIERFGVEVVPKMPFSHPQLKITLYLMCIVF